MKKIILPFVSAIIFGVIGYFLGFEKGYSDCGFDYKYRPIEQIKFELKQREINEISSYLDGKASIQKKDEGGLLYVDYVYYFQGEITNTALLAKVKDVKIIVDFYSKTKSKLSSQEIVLYDYISSGRTLKFKEKIDLPENYDNFTFSIVTATAE